MVGVGGRKKAGPGGSSGRWQACEPCVPPHAEEGGRVRHEIPEEGRGYRQVGAAVREGVCAWRGQPAGAGL